MTNRSIVGLGASTLLAIACSFSATMAQTINVGPNVQVSRARADQPHFEIHLAADPTTPGRLLGGAMIWDAKSAAYHGIAYLSRDGGGTWEPTLDIRKSDYVNDPAVAFGPEGAAYFTAFGADEGSSGVEMYVYRSPDGGQRWDGFVTVPAMDREWVTVDRSPGKYRGRVYVNGTRGARGIDGPGASGMSIINSSDGGRTFQGPHTLVVSDRAHSIIGMGNSVVLSDGTLVVLFGEMLDRNNRIVLGEPTPATAPASLKVTTSTDGGESFSTAKVAADWWMHFPGSMMPYLAVDESDGPFRGRLYAVFADYRSGRGEILLTSSADKGTTWSAPVVINDDLPANDAQRRDHFMPMVAVNSNGVVGVTWYDRREHPGNTGWLTRFAASVDGGETFLPSVPVSGSPYNMSRDDGFVYLTNSSSGGRGRAARASVSVHNFNRTGGHTAGLAASGGTFHPFWVDNRTGRAQIWTAAVTVNGKATRNGDAMLASLEDISSRARLELKNVAYESKTGRLLVDASIVNTSQDTLAGPVWVRVLKLSSQHGVPELTRSDNGRPGNGAALNMSALLLNGRLAPNAASGVRRLEFRLMNPRPLATPATYPNQSGASSLVAVDVRILAPRRDASSRGAHERP